MASLNEERKRKENKRGRRKERKNEGVVKFNLNLYESGIIIKRKW
jgi:hypothetical protein